jgi:UDP-glucose 4-epimerase
MRYLITGGAGFIGSHLAETLLRRGHSVHVLDDLSTGSIDNIRHLRSEPAFAHTIDSAGNLPVVEELVDDADVIYHLAAAVGVDLVVKSPVRAIETNVFCTEVVLSQANKRQKPLFLASTSEVYGKNGSVPFREDGDLLLGPTFTGRWSYACSKALDEYLVLAYWRERGLPAVVGRLFNTVGPRQSSRYGMVVPSLVRQALAGQPLTVFGDGSQRRCFCHVNDAVEAMIGLMEHDDAYGDVFNIGSTEEITILELAERVRELTGSSSEITFVPYDDAYAEGFEDVQTRVPDIGKITELLGWAPSKDLSQTLADVVEHRRAQTGLGDEVAQPA